MDLFFKALLGAAVVLIIAALSKTKNYYIAGLVPLFPTFALIAHYIVGKGRSIDDLKTTIVFGMWSIIPYFVYLATLYVMVDRLRLEASLAVAAVAWLMAATVLVTVWVRLHSWPSPQPSPGGRGGRPRCRPSYIDLKNRVDYGFATTRSGRRITPASPNQSPLPLGGPTFREG